MNRNQADRLASAASRGRATVARNRYRANGDTAARGWDVLLDGAGTVLSGLPLAWANRAAHLMNKAADEDAARAELARIRAAIREAA